MTKSKIIEGDTMISIGMGKEWISIVLFDDRDGEEYIIKLKKQDIMSIHDFILDAYIQE